MTEKINLRRNAKRIDQSLHAEVDQVVTVERDGHIKVEVRVTAYNDTKEAILLDEPYFIAVKNAFDVTADDLVNRRALTARHNRKRERLEVEFSEGTVLSPDEKFSWRVSFKSMWLGNMQPNSHQDLLTGIFVVTPLSAYKGVSISNHSVNLVIRFLRLNAKESLRRPVIGSFSNNLKIPMELADGSDGSEITFARFDLPRGTTLRALFNYSYQSAELDDVDRLSRLSQIWRNRVQPALRTVPVIVTAVSQLKELIDLFRR